MIDSISKLIFVKGITLTNGDQSLEGGLNVKLNRSILISGLPYQGMLAVATYETDLG